MSDANTTDAPQRVTVTARETPTSISMATVERVARHLLETTDGQRNVTALSIADEFLEASMPGAEIATVLEWLTDESMVDFEVERLGVGETRQWGVTVGELGYWFRHDPTLPAPADTELPERPVVQAVYRALATEIKARTPDVDEQRLSPRQVFDRLVGVGWDDYCIALGLLADRPDCPLKPEALGSDEMRVTRRRSEPLSGERRSRVWGGL